MAQDNAKIFYQKHFKTEGLTFFFLLIWFLQAAIQLVQVDLIQTLLLGDCRDNREFRDTKDNTTSNPQRTGSCAIREQNEHVQH